MKDLKESIDRLSAVMKLNTVGKVNHREASLILGLSEGTLHKNAREISHLKENGIRGKKYYTAIQLREYITDSEISSDNKIQEHLELKGLL